MLTIRTASSSVNPDNRRAPDKEAHPDQLSSPQTNKCQGPRYTCFARHLPDLHFDPGTRHVQKHVWLQGKNQGKDVSGTAALDAARHDEPEKKFEKIDPSVLPPQKAVGSKVSCWQCLALHAERCSRTNDLNASS